MASSGNRMQFVIDFDANTGALTATQKELDNLSGTTRRASSETDRLVNSLVKIGGAYLGLEAVKNTFENTITAGINLNRTIENATMGIGALISANTKLANASSLDKFNVAMSETDRLMKDIKTASIETAATFPQLTEVFQQAIGGALGAGKAMGQTLDEVNQNTLLLAKRMTNIASSIGMPMAQVNEEIRSIIEGTITADSRIAKMMGLTNEEIKKAKESANGLAVFLNNEFKDFDVLFGQMTFDKAVARVKDNLDTIRMEATKPLFDDLTKGVEYFNKILKENQQVVKKDVVEAYKNLKGVTLATFDTFKNLASYLDDLIVAYATYKVSVLANAQATQLWAYRNTILARSYITLRNSMSGISATLGTFATMNPVVAGITAVVGLATLSFIKFSDVIFDNSKEFKNTKTEMDKFNESLDKTISKMDLISGSKLEIRMIKENETEMFKLSQTIGTLGDNYVSLQNKIANGEIKTENLKQAGEALNFIQQQIGNTTNKLINQSDFIQGNNALNKLSKEYLSLQNLMKAGTFNNTELIDKTEELSLKEKQINELSIALTNLQKNGVSFSQEIKNIIDGTNQGLQQAKKVSQELQDFLTKKEFNINLFNKSDLEKDIAKVEEEYKKYLNGSQEEIKLNELREKEIAQIREKYNKKREDENKKLIDNYEKMWVSATKTKEEQNDIWLEDELKTLENSNLLAKDKLKAKDKLYDIWYSKLDRYLDEEIEKEKRANEKKLREDERYIKERLNIFSQSRQRENELNSLSFQKEKLTNPFANEEEFNHLQNIKSINDEIAKIEKEKALYIEKNVKITDEQAKTWQDNIDFLNDKKALTQEIYELENDELLKLENQMVNHFQTGFEEILTGAKSLGDGLEDIFKNIGRDILGNITSSISKSLSSSVTSAIFGGGNSGGGFNLNSLFGGGGFNLNTGLLNTGYTAKSDGSYYNADTKDTINEVTKNLGNVAKSANNVSNSLDDTFEWSSNISNSSNLLTDSMDYVGTKLTDFGIISGETSKSLSSFTKQIGSTAVIGGMVSGYGIGNSLGNMIDPKGKTYAQYGIGALGAGLGGAMAIGGLPAAGFLMGTPIGWALAAVAVVSTLFGKKRKVEAGYNLTKELKGYYDTEFGSVQNYELWKQKRITTKSTHKLTDMNLVENQLFAMQVNPVQDMLNALGEGVLSADLKKYTFKTFDEGLATAFIDQIVDSDIDITPIIDHYKDIAKENETSINQVIAETFASLIETKYQVQQGIMQLSGNSVGSFILQQKTLTDSISTIGRNFAGLGIDISTINLDNLDDLQEQLLDLNPTPESIASFNALSQAVLSAEQSAIGFIDSMSNKVTNQKEIDQAEKAGLTVNPKIIGAERVAEWYTELHNETMSYSDLIQILTTQFGFSAEEALAYAENLDRVTISSIKGSVGEENLYKAMGVSNSQANLLSGTLIDMATTHDYTSEQIMRIRAKAEEALLNGEELTAEKINKIGEDVKASDLEGKDIFDVKATIVNADELIDISKSTYKAEDIIEIKPMSLNGSGDTNAILEKALNGNSFAVGGYTPANNSNIDGKGGFLSILHPNEYVLNANQTSKHQNLVNLLEMERTGKIDLPSFYVGGYPTKKTRAVNNPEGRIDNTGYNGKTWLDDLSYMTTPTSTNVNDYTPFNKKYDFSKELIDLGFVDEFQTSLEDIGLTIDDFSLDNITKKMDELAGATAKTEEEYNKNSKAISYLTSAYLKAKETTQDILDIFKTDEEKFQDNTDVVTKLGFDKGFTFNDLDLATFDNLEAKIESIDFSKFSPEELEEFKNNLTPIANSLKDEKLAREENIKALKNQTLELQSSNTEFNQSLNRDSFYFGDFERNIDKSKSYGAKIGIDGIEAIGDKWTDWLSSASDEDIKDYVKSITSDSTNYSNENGEFDIGKAKSYIASEVDEYKSYLRDGLFAKDDFLKSYKNFGDNFLSEDEKLSRAFGNINAITGESIDKTNVNMEDFTTIINEGLDNLSLEDTEKFKESSELIVTYLNKMKSGLESFSSGIKGEIDNLSGFYEISLDKSLIGEYVGKQITQGAQGEVDYLIDNKAGESTFKLTNISIEKITNDIIEDSVKVLESLSPEEFLTEAEKVKKLVMDKYNYEKEQLQEQKSLVLSIKGSYESLESKYNAVNNINFTQEDLINQIEKIKTVSDEYLNGEISTFNTIYDSYIASLDKQIEVYDKTIESIEDLKSHIRDLRLGNLSYFSTTQKSEVAKTNYFDAISLLKGAISNGNTEDISKYLAEVKSNSQAYLSALRESGNIRGYSLEFDKVVGQIGTLTKTIGTLDVKTSDEIEAEKSSYLKQTMDILNERQPLINESLQSIDTHFKERELELKETALGGLKGIEAASQVHLSEIKESSEKIEGEFSTTGETYKNIESTKTALAGEGGIQTTNSTIATNTSGLGTTISDSIGNYSLATVNWLSSIKTAIDNLEIDVKIDNDVTITGMTATATTRAGYEQSITSTNPTNPTYSTTPTWFADGGFTGFDKAIDEIAGVVHGKEYVAPYKQIQKYPELFEQLEKDRKGFKSGGFTTPISLPKSSDSSNEIVKKLNELIEENKKMKKELEEIKKSSSRGGFYIEKIYKAIRDFISRSVA